MAHQITFTIPGVTDPAEVSELLQRVLREDGYELEVTDRVFGITITGRQTRRLMDEITATAVIANAFNYGLKVMPSHVQRTFYRQRSYGSQWGRHIPASVYAWAAGLVWREMPADQLPPGTAKPECRYFKTNDCGLLDGAVEHVGLSTELPRGKVFSVRDGHGWALATTQELPKRSATEAWLVLGPAFPDDKTLVPYTAFPGRMAAAVPADWDGDLAKLDLETVPYGVKYVSPETAELCA